MSNQEHTKYDFLGKKTQGDQVINDYPFKQGKYTCWFIYIDMRIKLKCHLCSNDQVSLFKCIQCQTHFCANCINTIKRTDENLLGNWVCFVCRKECPCQNCTSTLSIQDKDKSCLMCKSTTSISRVDQILDKITLDDQLNKEINENQWMSLLFQSNKAEKYLCDNCYNRIMPLLLMNIQNKQEQKQNYLQQQFNSTQTKSIEKKIEGNMNQNNIFNSGVPIGLQAQSFNDLKEKIQMLPKNDQGFPLMNNQYSSNPQGSGISQQQAILNDKGQYGNLLNDFRNAQMKGQSMPPPNISIPLPSFQGMNMNGVNQNESNLKVLLMMIYEAITVFFNQTLRNTANILENITLLLNNVHREVCENGLNSIGKNISFEMYLYKTAEEAMQTIFSIQVFHEQLKKLVLISLTPQELINNPMPFPNINPNNDADFLNFLKAQNKINIQDFQPPQVVNMNNFNPMMQNPSQSLNQNEKINSPLEMMAQFQGIPLNNKDTKTQQMQQPNISNNNNNNNVNQTPSSIPIPMPNQLPSPNFFQGQLNNLSKQGFNLVDLANLYIISQQNKPKQQQQQVIGSNVSNVNGLSQKSSMMNQNKQQQQLLQGQELQQLMQNNSMQMHPELLNPVTLMQFQKIMEQKANENNINSSQFKQ